MAEGSRPGPVIHPGNERFWAGLRDHSILIQRCTVCGTLRYPVSPVCFECLSPDHEWQPMSGRARLVSFVTVHRATGNAWWAGRTPFAVGLVQLEEGPQLVAGLPDPAGAELKSGMAVRATYVDDGPATFLEFVPI
jgi:uncharacterized OB-fold protein